MDGIKAIILAAGLGTRMGDLTKSTPKSLIKLNGASILEAQARMLNECGVKDISVVVGAKGNCWTKENQELIRAIANDIVVNPDNIETKNAYSLRLALEKSERSTLLVMDGDLIAASNLVKEIVNMKKDLVLAKRSDIEDDSRYKIIIDENGKVLEMGRIPKEKLSLPYLVYGALIRIEKRNFQVCKELISDEKYHYSDLSSFVNDLSRKIDLYTITDSRWININKPDDLEGAKKLLSQPRNFLILMTGYTAVGKSALARKLAKILNADIFHSSVVRKQLSLAPKTREEAEKFFNYRNKLRENVDRIVYEKMADEAKSSLSKGKNVILDAGHFFRWQRKNVYKKVTPLGAEIFILRVTCSDEEEIKRRLKNRLRKFGESPFSEAITWETYQSSKEVMEPPEDDILPDKETLNIIEHDTSKNKTRFVKRDKNSENTKLVMNALNSIGKSG